MYMKTIKNILLATAAMAAVGSMTSSCDDMLDMGNDYVIYTDGRELTNPADTATSVLGILNKIQGIVVRTNLMGELRGDLVTVNDEASSDLKDIANLQVQSGNAYNNIRDYYAVINNCNLFLATADSTAGNANRNEKYFKREIAQVHVMRAWTYLQAVKVYGKVPLVTEPVLTQKESNAEYPMYDLGAICDYFINDLKPYYAEELPDYGKIGNLNRQEALRAMFPSQVVMGDLYLWKAAVAQDKESAKQAAKCYYDYIIFDKNGKTPLRTELNLSFWSEADIQTGDLTYPTSYRSSGGIITSVPMDSAASEGYYNQLRELYNSSSEGTAFKYASISPSAQLKELSEAQSYAGFDPNRQLVYITRDKLSDMAIRNDYVGDLRFGTGFSSTIVNDVNKEYEYQSISKHRNRNYTVYRANQLYLRLAEALNYAGYPRFARQILTMGLSNNVITYEVKPYYTAEADQAFLDYFQFANGTFQPVAENFTPIYDQYGLVNHYAPVTSQEWPAAMMGIHAMGSGDVYANSQYAPLAVVDSTAFPVELFAAIPEVPVVPATVAEPSKKLTFEEWKLVASRPTQPMYERYEGKHQDSLEAYSAYLVEMEAYAVLKNDYDTKLEAFRTAATEWHNASYGDPAFILKEQQMVDQYVLDEQALELCYEGNRYYDLMRRALWWNDNTKLSGPVGKRLGDASKLNDRSNWFLQIED